MCHISHVLLLKVLSSLVANRRKYALQITKCPTTGQTHSCVCIFWPFARLLFCSAFAPAGHHTSLKIIPNQFHWVSVIKTDFIIRNEKYDDCQSHISTYQLSLLWGGVANVCCWDRWVRFVIDVMPPTDLKLQVRTWWIDVMKEATDVKPEHWWHSEK